MMTRPMRRFRQQLSAEETERILRNGKYCVMAVSGDDDYPYAVPVNYVYDGTAIFIQLRHCDCWATNTARALILKRK